MEGKLTVAEHPLLADSAAQAILEPAEHAPEQAPSVRRMDWRQAAGVLFILLGVAAVIGAWIGVSGSVLASDQLSYLTSGGLGGLVAVSIGMLLLVSYEHTCDRRALESVATRLQILEEGLADEFAHLYDAMGKRRG
jgi:hypothetical protein